MKKNSIESENSCVKKWIDICQINIMTLKIPLKENKQINRHYLKF